MDGIGNKPVCAIVIVVVVVVAIVDHLGPSWYFAFGMEMAEKCGHLNIVRQINDSEKRYSADILRAGAKKIGF